MVFWIWIACALVFAALEVFTPGFIMCAFSAGCIAAAVGAAISLQFIWQLVFFAMGLVAGFFVIRPLLQRRKAEIPSNTDRLIGMKALVEETIPAGGKGYVRIDGVKWLAASDVPIASGKTIIVKGIDGTTLIVEEE